MLSTTPTPPPAAHITTTGLVKDASPKIMRQNQGLKQALTPVDLFDRVHPIDVPPARSHYSPSPEMVLRGQKTDGQGVALRMVRYFVNQMVNQFGELDPQPFNSETKFFKFLYDMEKLLDRDHHSNHTLRLIAMRIMFLKMVIYLVGKNTQLPHVQQFWEKFGIRIHLILHLYHKMLLI